MKKERDVTREPKYTGSSIQDHLIFMRDTFSDTVPDRIVHSKDFDNRYKVRINWWTGLLANLEGLVLDDKVRDDLKPTIKEYVDNYYNSYYPGKLTTSDEIEGANRLINTIVRDEESDPMLWSADRQYTINFV